MLVSVMVPVREVITLSCVWFCSVLVLVAVMIPVKKVITLSGVGSVVFWCLFLLWLLLRK